MASLIGFISGGSLALYFVYKSNMKLDNDGGLVLGAACMLMGSIVGVAIGGIIDDNIINNKKNN